MKMYGFLDDNFEGLFGSDNAQNPTNSLPIENDVELVTNLESVSDTREEGPSNLVSVSDTQAEGPSSVSVSDNNVDESAGFSIDVSEHFITDQVFESKEDVVKWSQEVGRKIKSVVVIQRSERAEPGKRARLDLGCERSGVSCSHKKKIDVTKITEVSNIEGKKKRKRKRRETKKCGCPFNLKGVSLPNGKWQVRVSCGVHNHEMEKALEGHSYAGRLTQEERQILVHMTESGVKSKDILTTLKTRNIDNCSTMRTIYNERKKLRTTEMQGKSAMQQLIKLLEEQHYVYHQRIDEKTNSVISIFWAHPDSIRLTKIFNKVFMLDCTYKTDKYNMPLLEILGVTSTGLTFSTAFCFMRAETREDYSWALSCLRSLFDENRLPHVLLTDGQLALINAIGEVFPQAYRLLCTWHISKNVLTYCKKIIQEDKEREKFEQDWATVTRAPTPDEFYKLWDSFQASWVQYPDCVNYIRDTWVGQKEHFVEAWTNMVKHYGYTNLKRFESFHSRLKKHVQSRSGSFQTIWIVMHNMIVCEIIEVKGSFERSMLMLRNEHDIEPFKELKGRVSHYALEKLHDEVLVATIDRQLASDCLHVLKNTYGLPCVHELVQYHMLDQPIPLHAIDSQWKHLSMGANVREVRNDEVDLIHLNAPLENLKEKWEPSNEHGRQMIRSNLLEFMSPDTTIVCEPIRQIDGEMAVEPVNVSEYQELAKQALPKMYYDYYEGGAEDQYTLTENMEAFRRITFQPRILVDVSRIDMSTKILGYTISFPIMIAPTAYHKLAHPEGEIATAKAAASCNTIMVLSFMSTCTVEEVASSCHAIRFFQLYVYKRRDISAKLVQRAERSGYKAIVLTADTPRLGRREADIRNKMVSPHLKNFEGLLSTEVVSENGSNLEAFAAETFDPSLSWKDIGWLKSITNLPILIKGVLTAEDAIKAVEVGVAGVIVSNHGARQLDYAPATISVLEEVVLAVGGKVPVLFDGGIRRGTDVFKALALGAKAVLIGRPVIYGLAAKGEYGVRRVIEMLRDELELTMSLSGCPSVKDISRSHIRKDQERFKSLL